MIRLSPHAQSQMDAIKADIARISALFVGITTETAVKTGAAQALALSVKLKELAVTLKGHEAEHKRAVREYERKQA